MVSSFLARVGVAILTVVHATVISGYLFESMAYRQKRRQASPSNSKRLWEANSSLKGIEALSASKGATLISDLWLRACVRRARLRRGKSGRAVGSMTRKGGAQVEGGREKLRWEPEVVVSSFTSISAEERVSDAARWSSRSPRTSPQGRQRPQRFSTTDRRISQRESAREVRLCVQKKNVGSTKGQTKR